MKITGFGSRMEASRSPLACRGERGMTICIEAFFINSPYSMQEVEHVLSDLTPQESTLRDSANDTGHHDPQTS